MEDREEFPGDRKQSWPTRAQKRTQWPLLLTPQKPKGKAATKPSPKLQNLGHRSRCEQIRHAPGVEGQSRGEVLQNAASPGAYGRTCSHEGPKLQGNPPGDGQRHATKPRVHGREKIDTRQLLNQQNDRVWTSSSSTEGRIVTRRQKPQSVLVWAAVIETGSSPLFFVPSGVWRVLSQIKQNLTIADIFASCLLPWAKKHIQRVPWSMQQTLRPLTLSRSPSSGFREKSLHS